jgi:cyclohexyl-isocyanide hydratase
MPESVRHLHVGAIVFREVDQADLTGPPDPPFESGTPDLAPAGVLESVREDYRPITAARLATAQRYAARFD